jgi:putative heme-binding domain-containing protein
MKSDRLNLLSIVIGIHLLSLNHLTGQSPIPIQHGDVVAMVGAENMVRAQQAGHLEALVSESLKETPIRFRDLSWEGDTVSIQTTISERWREDKYGDWPQQLKEAGATVVWAQFGKMESLTGTAGLDSFTADYETLIHEWKKSVDRITLITPIAFESANSNHQPNLVDYNTNLAIYVGAIRSLATKHQLGFVDLFYPSLLAPERGEGFTKNGLHILPEQQRRYARLFASAAKLEETSPSETLRQAIVDKHRLWFEYWRPANWKCLFGDDGERGFGQADGIYPTFREEWKRYPSLITQAEDRIVQILQGISPREATKVLPSITGWSQTKPGNEDASQALSDFQLIDGFEVNLFASEANGIVNPLALRWDSTGNLYVACTTAYPQHEPGEIPNDFIVVLRDTTGDGIADTSNIFAEGLNIPTGIEVAPNGVYVGQGTQLLLLSDTDGDNVADKRETILSGFGNGDTHQTSNSFAWSPGGQLYWCQGDGIESRVETPWGVSRLFQAGVFRLKPERMQLEGLLDDFMGPGNPWGIAFDDWGQPIVIDGAGGVTHLGPALIPSPYRLRLPTIGRPGGYCGIDLAAHPSLPESMQGDFLIGDYKPNSVSRFALQKDGASYDVIWKEPIIVSSDEFFRPVDVKMGPDGAIYVCDWYNTVICHQDDSYRHTARDKGHGRIWRVARKNHQTIPTPKLAEQSIPELVDNLGSRDRWLREQSKRQLVTRDRLAMIDALDHWTASITPSAPNASFQRLQALMMNETIERINESLLIECLKAEDPRVRAYAARTVGRWQDRIPQPLSFLEPLTEDPDHQVRLEVILACGNIPSSKSVTVAAKAMRLPTDRWLDYGFTQTVRFLEPHWIPILSTGTLDFGGNNDDLIRVIKVARSKGLLQTVRQLATNDSLDKVTQMAARHVLANIGTKEDLHYLLEPNNYQISSHYHARGHASILQAIVDSDRARPVNDIGEKMETFLAQRDPVLKLAAVKLAAHWNVKKAFPFVEKMATQGERYTVLRHAAIECLPHVQPNSDLSTLLSLSSLPQSLQIQKASIAALAELDVSRAASIAIDHLETDSAFDLEAPLLRRFLSREGGGRALARAINETELSPKRAERLLNTLISQGHSDPELTQVLRDLAGFTSEVPLFSEEFIDALAEEVQVAGNPHAGESVFRSTAANCYSCHQIAGIGQALGPDLSNTGTGIPMRRLIEEVVWPTRHVKEGYALTQVTKKDGQVIQGYERKERDQADSLILEEFGTIQRVRIAKDSIQAQEMIGSIMPPTAVSLLTRPQLRDLIKFLSELGAPGEFSTQDRNLIRQWEVAQAGLEDKRYWLPLTTRVSGNINFSDVMTVIESERPIEFWLRTNLEVDDTRPRRLRFKQLHGLQIWLNNARQDIDRPESLLIPPGKHDLRILVSPTTTGERSFNVRW